MSLTQPIADDDTDAVDAQLASEHGLAIVRAAGPTVAEMLNTQPPHLAAIAPMSVTDRMRDSVTKVAAAPPM